MYNNTDYDLSKPLMIKRSGDIKNPLNKNKTNMEPLFNGNSLLLLKKIQDENKEIAKQLKDFNSKNFQLELSIKGINSFEVNNNIKNRKGSTSMLDNFTINTRNELKNIEKKYGLSKNK